MRQVQNRSSGSHASASRAGKVAKFGVMGVTMMMCIVVGRVAQLQLAPGKQLVDQRQERTTSRTVPGIRGDILDRNSRLLATTRFGWRVFVDPVEMDANRVDETIASLSDALAQSPEKLADSLLTAIEKNKHRLPASSAPTTGAAAAGSTQAAQPAIVLAGLTGHAEDDGEQVEAEAVVEESTKKPIRYVRVSGLVSDAVAETVRRLKLPGVHLEQRPVREYPAGDLGAAIVGVVNVDHAGSLGAEGRYDKQLIGRDGKLEYVRDALGRPLWIDPEGYRPAERGRDARLSIDLEVLRIATDELRRGIEDADAAGGRIIVLDPLTGEVLALADIIREVPGLAEIPWVDAPVKKKGVRGSESPSGSLYEPQPADRGPRPRYRIIKSDPARVQNPDIPALFRNRCVEDMYEPGSTFKPFVWAGVTAMANIPDGMIFNTQGKYWRTAYRRIIHDVHPYESQTWREVLINSSNIGMSQSVEMISADALSGLVRKLGFGVSSNLGLPGESPGRVTPRKKWRNYTQTSVSFGQEIAVTPVQMARAFAMFARPGELAGTLPPVTLTAVDLDQTPMQTATRIVPASVAQRVKEALCIVAAKVDEKMAAYKAPEKGWRYTFFGKSGTASVPIGKPPPGKKPPPGMRGYLEKQYMSSFIAAAPAEDPRLVVLTIIDDPGPEKVRKNDYYGSSVAGPVARRVLERSLVYLGVPPSPPELFVKPTQRKPGERDD